MTETRIDALLDELVPVVRPRSDGWEDVLARARTSRRRYAALAVAALALLLVPTAVALRERITDLFQGTPAPFAISTTFEANNKTADTFTQRGFGDKFPHADVSQAHGVIEIQTADGPQGLWSAPSDMGGTCYFIDWANDAPEPNGQQFGFGGCSRSAPPTSGIGWGASGATRTPTYSLSTARSTHQPRAPAFTRRRLDPHIAGGRGLLPRVAAERRQGRSGHRVQRLRRCRSDLDADGLGTTVAWARVRECHPRNAFIRHTGV